MGIMAVPDKTWVSRLGLTLKIEGVLFSMLWLVAYTMKFGAVWHDAGPPFGPTTFRCSACMYHSFVTTSARDRTRPPTALLHEM